MIAQSVGYAASLRHDRRHLGTRLFRAADGRGVVRHVGGALADVWHAAPIETRARFVLWCVLSLIIAQITLTSVWKLCLAGPHFWQGLQLIGPAANITILGMLSAALLTEWRRAAGALAKRTVQQGRCASCGYDIGLLTPEADGCVVCPECGGAWARGSD